MGYRHYTRCIGADNHIGLPLHIVAILIMVAPVILVTGFLPGTSLTVILALIAYCRWWLYDRLVCLGGERCAVGLLVGIYPPEEKSCVDPLFDCFDTDYSIDLFLAPSNSWDNVPKILAGFQAELIRETDITKSKGWSFEGYKEANIGYGLSANAPGVSGAVFHHPVLHCEFEGGGVYDLYLAALAALPFVAAAAAACSIPAIGWVVCAILLIIAGIILGSGIIVALNDKGDPAHVNPFLGELVKYEDILLVRGTWVYDSAHEGWNEIHPIKHCQRVGTWSSWNKTWPNNIEQLVEQWCTGAGKASSPLTIENQKRPENQWRIHPLVDGCAPAEEQPPEIH